MQNNLDKKMKRRSPGGVFWLSLFTGGLYSIYWAAETKGNVNRLGAKIPTAFLLWVPLANIWWMWKYSEGVDKVTKGSINKVFVFIMLIFSLIGLPVLQSKYNDYA